MSDVLNSIGRQLYQLSFQVSPIILNNGIAGEATGSMLPIVALTEAANFVNGLLNGSPDLGLDDFFAHFKPMGGATLIDFQVGEYPFANQQVAANAIMAMPLKISLRMDCPVKSAGGFVTKLITFQALQSSLSQHSLLGGTYTVVTNAYIYTNCLLVGLRDIGDSGNKVSQTSWQFDFVQPLITMQQATAAQNSLNSKITNQTPIDGQPTTSGPTSAVGSPLSAPGTGGGAANLTGSSVGGYQPGVDNSLPSGDGQG